MTTFATSKINFLFVIGLATFTYRTYGQDIDSRFIVFLGHFVQPFLNETVIQCAGTLISVQHILCTASCVVVESPTQIAVEVSTTTLVPEGGYFTATSLHPAHRVYIHPFYDNAQYTNNAAIVMTSVFQSNPQLGFAPRSLGSLSTSESCELIGWGGDFLNPRRDAVTVNSPDSCDPNYPQNFCTNFDSNAHVTCSAKQGSPLICGSEMVLAGFVTNVNGCTTNDAGQTVLNYHSIDDFRDWIEGVFGPELPKRNAVNFVVTVMERNVNSTTPRCYGTIISSSRVITTATCATIEQESFLTLELQTRIVVGSTASTVNWNPSRIFIHPYFNPDNPFDYNVAVIEINGIFDPRIVPRSFGHLEQESSSCQLFGWGPTDYGFTRGDSVTVYGSESCDPQHSQAYCSSHSSIFDYSCTAMTGSPVTCDGSELTVAGFLINNATCIDSDGHVALSYHSVGDFSDWISDPTLDPGAARMNRVSISFIFCVFIVNSIMN